MKRSPRTECSKCSSIGRAPREAARSRTAGGLYGAEPPIEPGGPAAGPVIVTSDGIEVTQAIQNMNHLVPLVAGKRTVVRVCLSATSSTPLLVHGLLKARRRPRGRWHFIRSAAPAHIDPAENGQLRVKREHETKSLNFILPAALGVAGQLEVKLAKVWQTAPVTFLVPPLAARRTVTFVSTPPFRVRVLGIRYQFGTPASSAEPSPLDYTLIESWLRRAYPVAEVQWSQAVVNGPSAWPFNASTINAFVRGIRMSDVLGGVDDRTHYYGLVADTGGFMRGLASGIPGAPDPSTVASGPTGPGTFGWDTDGSYGDWYTGHELAHTLGRFHAEFCGAVGGAPYPFTNGQLSNADGVFVGFDTGDAAHGLPMRALPGTVWHDVMSYCSSQWLSSFTYTGIRDRIVQEDALPAGAALEGPVRRARGRAVSRSGSVHVVATLNLTRASGRIRHVTAYDRPARRTTAVQGARGRRSAEPDVSLRFYGSGPRPRIIPVAFIRDACTNRGDDVTGTVDTLLPAIKNATRLELVLNGQVVDTFSAGDPVGAVRNIHSARPARASTRRSRAAAGTTDDVEEAALLTWQPSGGARRARARAERAPSPVHYTVQISTDDGATWRTATFDSTEPQARIDRQLFGDADTIKVRVVATNGFRRAVSEKTMAASDF